MKKGFIIFAAAVLMATLMNSCKVVDPCPAYGQVDVEQQDAEV